VLGPEHPGTAISLDNLALLLSDQGDLAAARPLHARALAVHEKVLGPEHPDTATSLNNLAGLLSHQGDLAEAGDRSCSERLPVGVPDDEAGVHLFGLPGRREAAGRSSSARYPLRVLNPGPIYAR
jgi:hypothetical protein